ncbi:amidohydrolase family protein [Arthrobacter sp. StoSoilB22]|uniref:amidohydrolase family protein n=1 Tax=Arthrobacter sp. StoSoilB22 TaxID=2830996 RepID=UPI001CC7B9A1|nr:amidohydrolase family protein [Arthrobacter sp. StoSoilB22]BCW62844.1 hydrolase [Arthrobacter sp. StoSoilB22]
MIQRAPRTAAAKTPLPRRVVVQGIVAGAAIVAFGSTAAQASADRETPFSAGRGRARYKVPGQATDAHMHIYDPVRFPYPFPGATPPPRATVADYRLLQERTGTKRTVVVTPSNYGTDNRCTLEAIGQLGLRSARGIAVIDDSFSTAQLQDLHQAGIRGIRFNLTRPGGAGAELIRSLAARIAPLGWHVQIHMSAEGILENLKSINDLPTDLVIDHMGRIPGSAGTSHPAFEAITRLLDGGKTWVKLSGVYHESQDGPPTYADRGAIGAAFARYAPDRMVWGSDWPHPTASRGEVPMPDDAAMLDMFANWVPTRQERKRILVDNPEKLYDF